MSGLNDGRINVCVTIARIMFIGILLPLMAVTGLAHARLVRSEPKAKDNLPQPPSMVELWFSEALEPELGAIEVTDNRGTRVDRGEPLLSEENKKLQVQLGQLDPGIYTVAWKAVSTDEHAMHGSFTFTLSAQNSGPVVAAPNGDRSEDSPPIGDQNAGPNGRTFQDEPISWGQTLARWVSYLALITLMGSFAFRVMVLAPMLARVKDRYERLSAIVACERRILRIAGTSAILLFLSLWTALVFQAMSVFDKSLLGALSPGILAHVLATGYGPYWIHQISSLGVLSIFLLAIAVRLPKVVVGDPPILWWLGFAMSFELLVAPTWTGHALASFRDFNLSVFSDWLHLVAAGIWVGGLFHLALTLPLGLSRLSKPQRVVSLHFAIKRFTRVAMPSVAVLVLAGLYNTWAHVPRIQAFWMTPYGRVLLFKLGWVAIMLLLGAIHNFHFGKRIAGLAQTDGDLGGEEHVTTPRRFLRSVGFEAALGVVVLLVTAILVFMTPARNHPAMMPDSTGSFERK